MVFVLCGRNRVELCIALYVYHYSSENLEKKMLLFGKILSPRNVLQKENLCIKMIIFKKIIKKTC